MSLAVSPSVLETLVTLSLVWDGQFLKIASSVASDDVASLVSAVFLEIMDFRISTDTRWLIVGSSCTSLVASAALGLSQLVEMMCADSAQNQYHIGAFRQHFGDFLPQLAVGALGSFVADGVLQMLLEDDRVMLVKEQLEQRVVDELGWLQSLGMSMYRRLAITCASQSTTLAYRSEIVVIVSAGYFSWKVLRVARSRPWCLTVGDMDESLLKLQDDADVVDVVVAGRLQQLMRMGSGTR